MRDVVRKGERKNAIRYDLLIEEDARNMSKCCSRRRNSLSEFRVPISDDYDISVSTCAFLKWPEEIHSFKIDRCGQGKQLRWTFASIAILIASTAVVLVYSTVDFVLLMWSEELSSQRVIHSALFKISCHRAVGRQW